MNIGELERKLDRLAQARAKVAHAQAVYDRHHWHRSWCWRDRQIDWINHLECELEKLREEKPY
jgi:hypothetical protein